MHEHPSWEEMTAFVIYTCSAGLERWATGNSCLHESFPRKHRVLCVLLKVILGLCVRPRGKVRRPFIWKNFWRGKSWNNEPDREHVEARISVRWRAWTERVNTCAEWDILLGNCFGLQNLTYVRKLFPAPRSKLRIRETRHVGDL